MQCAVYILTASADSRAQGSAFLSGKILGTEKDSSQWNIFEGSSLIEHWNIFK